MRLLTRFGSRRIDRRDACPTVRRPANARLQVQSLEDRSLPSFGFGSAFGVGGTGGDIGHRVVLDAAGGMYVSGYFSNAVDFDPTDINHMNSAATLTAINSSDGFVAKYSSGGDFQWVTDLGISYTNSDQVATQGSNVYLAYVGLTSTGAAAGYVSALNAGTGAVNWTTSFGANSQAWDVAASPSGILYADGFTTAVPAHAFVARLDPASGNILWTQTSGAGEAWGGALAVDMRGNAYASGMFDPYDPINIGYTTFGNTVLTEPWNSGAGFVWNLNPNGGTIWAGGMTSYGGVYPQSIAADGSGNVYLTGYWGGGGSNNFNPGSGKAVSLPFNGVSGAANAFIVKLTPGTNGAMKLGWAKEIGGSGNDEGNAVAVDGAGNVYTTGWFTGTVNFNPNTGPAHNLSGGGVFVSKLDANGNFVAAASMAGTAEGNSSNLARGIALDGAGNVYTTGFFSGTADFDPTGGTYNLTSNGGNDVFVSVLTQSNTPSVAMPGVTRANGTNTVPSTSIGDSAVTTAAGGLSAVDLTTVDESNDWFAAETLKPKNGPYADWLISPDA